MSNMSLLNWLHSVLALFALKANVPKQRAANLMETSNLRTVPEDRHCRQSSLKYQQPLRLKIILPFLFKKNGAHFFLQALVEAKKSSF